MAKCSGNFNKCVAPRSAFAKETTGKTPTSQKEERVSWRNNFTSPEKYIKEKLRMLRKDMYIEPTLEELQNLNSKTTEVEIDAAVRKIVARAWSD